MALRSRASRSPEDDPSLKRMSVPNIVSLNDSTPAARS